MYATELQSHLHELQAERALATLVGLEDLEAYMADLEDEIDAVREAYIGAAVTEIAVLRAELSGRPVG